MKYGPPRPAQAITPGLSAKRCSFVTATWPGWPG